MTINFYYLLISESSTKLAYTLYSMTIITFIYQTTNSATLASAITIISMMAQLLSGSTVPLIMDKWSIKKIVLLSQLFQLIFYISIIFLLFVVPSPLIFILVFIFLALISFFNGWSNPTRSALVPEVVSKDRLVHANSVLSTTNQTLLLLGWSLGGVFVVYLGHVNVIMITIMLLVISILSFMMVKTNATKQNKNAKGRLNSLKEGWIIVFKHPTLSTITKMDMLALFLVVLMGPLYQVRDIAQNTFIQNTIPGEDLAKYLAAKTTLNQLIFSLSILIIGVLVDIMNARFVYLFSGILLLCSGLYGYLKLFKKYNPESQSI